ncbi:MAG: class I SAM-dependent methyltransferase [Actinobacteria bacterium]|nr:class I SAM-dependent methyltransferase [Actinomycetota bacterium]
MMESDTSGECYAARLERLSGKSWKRFIPDPYRWNIRRSNMGRMLDVGCGIGRCLMFNGGNGVGVDHNPTSVSKCRSRGLEAYTPEEFSSLDLGLFDSVLLSHVLEHTSPVEGRELLNSYLPYLKPGGMVMLITPQLAGQKSDPTHVRFLDRQALADELMEMGAKNVKTRSFPFPEVVGRAFRHNESQAIAVFSGGVGPR